MLRGHGVPTASEHADAEKVLSLGLVPDYLESQILTSEAFEQGVWVLPLSEGDQQRPVDAWTEVQRG